MWLGRQEPDITGMYYVAITAHEAVTVRRRYCGAHPLPAPRVIHGSSSPRVVPGQFVHRGRATVTPWWLSSDRAAARHSSGDSPPVAGLQRELTSQSFLGLVATGHQPTVLIQCWPHTDTSSGPSQTSSSSRSPSVILSSRIDHQVPPVTSIN